MKYLSENEIYELIPEAYELKKYERLECISSTGVILRHKKSGARVALFINDDENKLFSAAFYTSPEDNCGTPHIIEHSVLCGSERYPVKDPFMQLVKSSMQTFLNAMTYADKTVYPVSSCNDADFINLSNIYLDAVFAPNIAKHKEVFMQEGWHYEPNEDGSCDIGGVVYSEMLGAVSSPDSNVYDGLICALFPDNAYSLNSGGDPDHIPSLTYEAYLDYYRRHYNPSNCYITLYGNMDFAERLSYIDREYLSAYSYTERPAPIAEQPPFGKGNIRRVTETYPVSSDEDTEGKSFLAYGVVCADSNNAVECLAYDFLSDILVESPGSPVKKALISAGIGDEVYGGFLNHMKHPAFSVIAKNTDTAEADRFYSIINDTLKEVAENGVNKRSLLAAIERSEFRFREGEQGSTSRGLNANLSMLQNWLYSDDDPFAYIRADELLSELRYLCDTDFYEGLVRRLIDPEHGAIYILEAERGMNERKASELREKLDAYRSEIGDEGFDKLCCEYEAYTEYQNREESEEELSCIPVLSREDISREAHPLYIREEKIGGADAIIHDIDTNGIAYVRLMFDIAHIPNEDLFYLDLLFAILGKTDTESYKYEELLDEIRLNTGGFGFTCEMYRCADGSFRPMCEVNLRVLAGKLRRACDLVREILEKTDLGDKVRIKEIITELISEKQRDIVTAGSEFAAARALAYFNPADAAEDYLDGIAAYMSEKELCRNFDESFDEMSSKFESLIDSIFVKRRLTVSITADEKNMDDVVNTVADFVSIIPYGDEVTAAERLPMGQLNEGFMTTSKVQYVAVAGNLDSAGYKYRGEYQILASLLKNDYLYPEIRMKGGAYGYTCSFSVNSGNVCMATYRDPCLAESLEVFAASGEFIRSVSLDESDVNCHVIGTFGKLDRPMSVYMKASRSIAAYMSGRTYDDISKDRQAMLNADAESLRSLAASVDAVMSQNYICVIGNEEKILENKHLFGKVLKLG